MIAWLVREAARCKQCGTFIDDWMDPKSKRPVEPPPYVPEELRCRGCLALAERREEIGSEEGVYVRFIRKT